MTMMKQLPNKSKRNRSRLLAINAKLRLLSQNKRKKSRPKSWKRFVNREKSKPR